MVKSKWNCGKAIPISALSKDELSEAIHEWSEGNPLLEELLWLCHKKGVETMGCESGEHHFAYIDIALRSDRESLCKVLNEAINGKNCSLMFSFCGNPRSGPLWYEPHMGIFPNKRADVKNVYSNLCTALKKPWGKKPSELSKQLLNIADFLKDKETGLTMRLYEGDVYMFALESYGNSRNWDYFTKIFETAGLRTLENKKPNLPLKAWGIKTKNVFDLADALKALYEHISVNWNLELPDKFTPDMDFNSMALIMRRKYGTDLIGLQMLDDWVKNNWGKPFDEISE